MEKCRGCQSFCMQGHQLAMMGPDGNNPDYYPGGWKQWGSIKTNDTICIPDKLSAKSQKDLVDFIERVYNEGENSIEKGLKLEDVKPNGLEVMQDATTSCGGTTLRAALTDGDTGNDIKSNSVIYAGNYNNLLQPLVRNYDPVTEDPKGEGLSDKDKQPLSNNATEAGPVAGWPASLEEVQSYLVLSGQDESGKNSDLSLIKATEYTYLYEQASHLMYHPYQCNICNVYEGGEWLEIVKEMKRKLAQFIADNHLKDGPLNLPDSKYSQHGGSAWNGQCNGIPFRMGRRDCSAFVGTCVYVYGISCGENPTPNLQHWTTGDFDAGTQEMAKLGFSRIDGIPSNGILTGDIELDPDNHVQVAASDGGGTAYNCGSNSSADDFGPSGTYARFHPSVFYRI